MAGHDGSGAFGLRAHRYHTRSVLLAATALMAATGVGFALFEQFWPLLLIAFVGTLNPSSGDVSVFLPLEHALLSRFSVDRDRTTVFARYSLVGALAAACGALAAAAPDLLTPLRLERWRLLRYDVGHQETPEGRREALAFLKAFL